MKNYKEARKLAVELIGEHNLGQLGKRVGVKKAVAVILWEYASNIHYADRIAKVL